MKLIGYCIRVYGSGLWVEGWRAGRNYMKREISQKKSGNEVHYTNSSMLLVKNMLCSELHFQEDLI